MIAGPFIRHVCDGARSGAKEMTVVPRQLAGSHGKYTAKVNETPPPTAQEIGVLREIQARTKLA